MLTCRLTIKIKDYFPKTDTIPYSNYICLFTCGEYQGQIPFLPDETKYLQHLIKNISSDIKYKVLILDFNDMTLIGMCEMTIAYKILNGILPQNGFIQEQQKKLLIDMKTKRKLFGTVINSGDIYLNIYAEVFIISKNINEQKIKNSKSKKNNHPIINTPKCYIKYNFALNKNDFSPKSSKNNKSTMVNSGSEKQTLNSSKQENRTNKYSNHNSINFKKENEKKNNLRNYSNYNIINNNINFFNKKSEAEIYNNKKNIMDLLQQKKMMDEIVENYNKSELEEKNEIDDNDEEINNNLNNLYIKNKGGFMTEQNFNPKFFINNNKTNQKKYVYKINNNINDNNEYNNIDDEDENKKFFYYSKNTLSPNAIKDIHLEEENRNMSKTLKNKNNINPNINIINTNFVYNSKSKMMKMGKVFTKGKINDNMKQYTNHTNNNESRRSNDIIYQNYLTNTNYNNYTQLESNSNTYNYATNTNNIYDINKINMNIQTTKSSEEEEIEDDEPDIDRIILEKGAELRNDFHSQIKKYPSKSNNHKTLNSLSNNLDYYDQDNNINYFSNYNKANINYYSRTPFMEKNSKYSSTQSLDNYLSQEDVKNNCIKLIEFYSLLNLKLKKIFPKNDEINQKLIIFKELLSSELKKKNIIKNKLSKNNFIYNIATNINEATNEKILNFFPKIKKIENSIYQQLFNVFNTQEELAKYSEYENYDKQTKIFLLLNLARNLVKKYGNISQVFTIKNTVNMKKKKTLKKCLQNYLIVEKESGDKDFINLEKINILNRDMQKNKEYHDENKFRVIKEVDEDKEEENEEEQLWSEGNEIKEVADENRDQIIEDIDFIEDNNINENNNNNTNNDKSLSKEHINENGEENNVNGNNNDVIHEQNENNEKKEKDDFINIEDDYNQNNNSEENILTNNNNTKDKIENIGQKNDEVVNEEKKDVMNKEQNNKEKNSDSMNKENRLNIEKVE